MNVVAFMSVENMSIILKIVFEFPFEVSGLFLEELPHLLLLLVELAVVDFFLLFDLGNVEDRSQVLHRFH